MEWMAVAPITVVAAFLGMVFGWFVARARAQSDAESKIREAESIAQTERIRGESLEAQRLHLQSNCDELHERLRVAETGFAESRARAEETQKRFEEERELLAQAERKLTDTFKSLASDTLRQSSGDFLKFAEAKLKAAQDLASRDFEAREKKIEDIVKPARDSLARLDEELRKMENDRRGVEGQLTEQLRHLGAQTGKLFDALRTPSVRGRWGEIQLKRVVEIAGMVEHCEPKLPPRPRAAPRRQ